MLSSLYKAVVWLYEPVASNPLLLGEKAIEDIMPDRNIEISITSNNTIGKRVGKEKI